MDQSINCPYCKGVLPPSSYFCLHCGKKIREKPLSTTSGKQIVIYLISVAVPPSGFWWAVKYLRQPDPISKRIGIAAVVLTTGSLIVSILLYLQFIQTLNQTINSQLNYPGLEY